MSEDTDDNKPAENPVENDEGDKNQQADEQLPTQEPQQEPNATTANDPNSVTPVKKTRKKSANYTTRQREWIFYCLAVARCQLNVPYTKTGELVYSRLIDILQSLTPPDESLANLKPSHETVRQLWRVFKNGGSMARDYSKTGRKFHPASEAIKEALKNYDFESLRSATRQIPDIVGCGKISTGLIKRIAKEQKLRFGTSKK